MADTDNMMGLFKAIILVQLFFSFAITGISYTIPDDAKHFVSSFSDLASEIDLEGTSTQIKNSIEQQTNIPVIELGALVFYSGNILIDLLLNFAFAIPEMIGLVISGIMMFLSMDSYLLALVQIFAAVVTYALYFIGLMQLMTNVRSGRII
jgi:hypothetical protein